MSENKSNSHAAALSELIAATIALISQYRTSLLNNSETPATSSSCASKPLEDLRDAARLLKAHTTKIALLAVNKPFTPGAVSKIVRDVSIGCLPVLVGGAQACEQQRSRLTALMAGEAKLKVQILLVELMQMLKEVESINQGGTGAGGRDSLSSTGIVWQYCDALVALEQTSIASLAVAKAEQYRDTLQDAVEELEAWKDGSANPDTEGRDGLLDSDDEAVDGDHDSIEDFNAENAMPSDRPDIEELLDDGIGKLKKLVLLYTALIKRRLKTFKYAAEGEDNENRVRRLDATLAKLKIIPDRVDDLAAAFYSLNTDAIKQALTHCMVPAREMISQTLLDWENAEDQYTSWAMKWNEVVA